MKLKASLEKISAKKLVHDDVSYRVEFTIWPETEAELGQLAALYCEPLELTIDISKGLSA